jgi:hypothetical protein
VKPFWFDGDPDREMRSRKLVSAGPASGHSVHIAGQSAPVGACRSFRKQQIPQEKQQSIYRLDAPRFPGSKQAARIIPDCRAIPK